jgi:translation initiation factor 6
MLRLGDIGGNPYIGVYCAASESLAILSDAAEPRTVKDIARTLDVQVVKTIIAGSTIVGSLVAMNSHGVVVTNFAEKHEISRFPKGLRVGIMQENINAAGNNILANDSAALVNPNASGHTLRMLEDVFDVEVSRGRIAGIETVGSSAICTSKGVLCHPLTTQDELKELSGFFKVPASAATLNYGTPYLGACAVANSKGAFVGSRTTPIELGRLEDGLGLF